ncbi:hypothetical protein M440DRAFT_1321521 [Trichoderma longibrachiatum ATCC 18648]|uniref:Mid2 domain-containing protein n=1 Tax=Trichoderma longibrachiatum ATCC 18648 TaxID=983965 RepID=A0A2T4CIW2_TRILO|nr:hypothetical protein M440DRAFT_1321521 [Trichoderma longibrachiatum ATCC 18648]
MALTLRTARLLLLVSALASFASASPAGLVFQESKCSAGTQSCPAGLPNNFCCSEGTSCIPLAGNTTVMCCPTGQTCEKIQPITCDVSQQDPSKNQQSPIKTSVFNVPLAKCGADLCCPFGYSCSGDDLCVKDSDQSEAPEKATSSTTASPATSSDASSPASSDASSPTSSSTSSSTADASSGTPDPSSSHASNPKTVSIIGGVIGGCAVLIVLGAIAFLFIRRRNLHRKDGYSEKPTVGRIKHLGPGPRAGSIISDPILQPNSYRTDFIRKSPSIGSSISQRPPQIAINNGNPHQRLSIPNPFDSPSPSNHSDHSPTGYRDSVTSEDERNARTGIVGSGSRLPPIRAMRASSRRVYPQDLRRESTGENIDVFADPFTMTGNYDRRGTHATTFTDLMIEADLGDVRRGQPYLMPPLPPHMNRI